MSLDLRFLLKRIFTKKSAEFVPLQAGLGYFFRNPALLREALTHRSHCEERNSSYERLEFLGDSVIGLIISRFLYENFPQKTEGDLTKLKASLVSEMTLTRVAQLISLGQYVVMGKEEEKAGGREKPSILSDAYEALVGAVFLDGGLQAAENVIEKHILSRISEMAEGETFRNYKGELLEFLQARGKRLPRYQVLEEKGPDHDKKFTTAVFLRGTEWGRGSGTTKKEAEQNAARVALEKLRLKQEPE